MAKGKRYTKKQIKKILDLYEKDTLKLIRNKGDLINCLDEVDAYISDNGVKFDKLSGLKTIISLLRDNMEKAYDKNTAECLIESTSSLLNIMSNIDLKKATDKEYIPNDVVIRYIRSKYKGEIDEYRYWRKWIKSGEYPMVPISIIDNKEDKEMASLEKRYDKLMAPSSIGKVTQKLKDIVPDKIKAILEEAGHEIVENELYKKIMEEVADGFETIMKYAAKVTISEKTVVDQVNKTMEDNHIFKLEEVCYARGYDISKLVNSYKTQNIGVALAEGATTGIAGLPGIIANIFTSTFIYYRAVQSIAMYYGYDVKNDPKELDLATEVFMQAIDPTRSSASELGDTIAKFMAMSQALVVKETIKKGWQGMAEQGGICLLIAQIRALANKAAMKAVQAAGERGLEVTLFEGVLKTIGKKLTQKAVAKGVNPAAAVVTALMDVSSMNKITEYADVFYNKRFLYEKQTRIDILRNPGEPIDVEYEIIEE